MKRYQIYLNPQSVKTIDAFQKEITLSRSQIIRSAIDALAQNLSLALPSEKRSDGPLDAIIGIIKGPTNKKTNVAENIDSIYLKD